MDITVGDGGDGGGGGGGGGGSGGLQNGVFRGGLPGENGVDATAGSDGRVILLPLF